MDSELGKCTFEEAFSNTFDVDLGFTIGVEEPAVFETLSDSVPPTKCERSQFQVEVSDQGCRKGVLASSKVSVQPARVLYYEVGLL